MFPHTCRITQAALEKTLNALKDLGDKGRGAAVAVATGAAPAAVAAEATSAASTPAATNAAAAAAAVAAVVGAKEVTAGKAVEAVAAAAAAAAGPSTPALVDPNQIYPAKQVGSRRGQVVEGVGTEGSWLISAGSLRGGEGARTRSSVRTGAAEGCLAAASCL